MHKSFLKSRALETREYHSCKDLRLGTFRLEVCASEATQLNGDDHVTCHTSIP